MRPDRHGILDPMMKRLAAILIAVAVGAAPVAVEICQLACASRPMHSHAVHTADAYGMHGNASQPSCHDTAQAAHTLSPDSAPCDHNDAVIASSLVTTRPGTVTSVPVQVVALDLANTARTWFADRGQVVDPVNRLALRLASRLRI